MVFFKKIVLFFILFISPLYFLASPVYGEEDFETFYKIIYTVQPDASVVVEQNITLTNKEADVYATQYSLSLGTTQIKNIWAKDSSGAITPEIEKGDNLTNIRLHFNDMVVGKYKTLDFTLSYTSDDYASLNGKILEIGIPKVANSQNLKDHQVHLQVPVFFQDPILILPEPQHSRTENDFNIYSFNKDQLIGKSIIASFGEKQIFDFKLAYHLENDENKGQYFEIAFPPDTPFQKLYYEDISPPPENIYLDQDANWLASYLVEPDTILDIIAIGSAEIYSQPETEIKKQELDDFIPYLKSLAFWETESPEIKQLANQLKTVRNIYDYVVNNLNYNYEIIEQVPPRMGALQALSNKDSVVCMEFTDLFVALSRAAGIPAREVNGYAHTENPKLRPLSLTYDVLHSWPEYYDKKKKLWIGVDPTWENTAGIDFFSQLGLNHFGFVFHGLDSIYPYSPGSYKAWLQQSKDVEITFGEEPVEKQEFDLILDFPKKAIAGSKINGKVKIANKGNTAIYEKGFEPIPPFAYLEKKVSLKKTGFFTKELFKSRKTTFDYTFKNKKESVEVEIVSPLLFLLLPLGAIIALGLGIFMILLKARNKLKNKQN